MEGLSQINKISEAAVSTFQSEVNELQGYQNPNNHSMPPKYGAAKKGLEKEPGSARREKSA